VFVALDFQRSVLEPAGRADEADAMLRQVVAKIECPIAGMQSVVCAEDFRKISRHDCE
jgi:hypothetical protein